MLLQAEAHSESICAGERVLEFKRRNVPLDARGATDRPAIPTRINFPVYRLSGWEISLRKISPGIGKPGSTVRCISSGGPGQLQLAHHEISVVVPTRSEPGETFIWQDFKHH